MLFSRATPTYDSKVDKGKDKIDEWDDELDASNPANAHKFTIGKVKPY